jgi:formylglycine-generating enzyme required for sulfatase activity
VLGILLLFTAVSALWASRENFKYKNLVSKFTALNIKNANEHIQNLEYDKAHEILMKSLFFTKTDQEAVATALMETAFFYAETTKSAYRGWQVLDTIATVLNKKELLAGHKRDLTGFHQVLNDLNPNQEEWLMKRYFPVMVMVKGGTYTLIDTDRTDTITVTLSTYQIGETEVTRWQYFLYCKSTGVKFPTTWLYDGSKPITYVCWLDALKYANWLSKRMNYTEVYSDSLFMELDKNKNLTLEDSLKLLESIPYYPTANGYRLPTEAQWEFAANEGHPSVKYRYAGSNTLNDVAWNRSNSNDILQPVKTKNPNKLGLFDMTGNVMEWCWDWYDQYSLDNHENPTGPSSGTLKVVRGASKNEYQEQSVINKRQRKLPYFKDRGILGFRLARNVEK